MPPPLVRSHLYCFFSRETVHSRGKLILRIGRLFIGLPSLAKLQSVSLSMEIRLFMFQSGIAYGNAFRPLKDLLTNQVEFLPIDDFIHYV
jgi:hypothetical protein